MPCPHFSISIASRATGSGAVASAAYQSGERLYSDSDQVEKNYSYKRGIEYAEILLPEMHRKNLKIVTLFGIPWKKLKNNTTRS